MNESWDVGYETRPLEVTAKKPPALRLTIEVEGLTIGDAQHILRALDTIEIPFSRSSTIIEVMED